MQGGEKKIFSNFSNKKQNFSNTISFKDQRKSPPTLKTSACVRPAGTPSPPPSTHACVEEYSLITNKRLQFNTSLTSKVHQQASLGELESQCPTDRMLGFWLPCTDPLKQSSKKQLEFLLLAVTGHKWMQTHPFKENKQVPAVLPDVKQTLKSSYCVYEILCPFKPHADA